MEALQAAFPAAHFVKAFNSVGAARMVNCGASQAFARGIGPTRSGYSGRDAAGFGKQPNMRLQLAGRPPTLG